MEMHANRFLNMLRARSLLVYLVRTRQSRGSAIGNRFFHRCINSFTCVVGVLHLFLRMVPTPPTPNIPPHMHPPTPPTLFSTAYTGCVGTNLSPPKDALLQMKYF